MVVMIREFLCAFDDDFQRAAKRMTFGLQLAVKAAFLLENATKIWAKASQAMMRMMMMTKAGQAMMRMKMTMTQFNRQ